MQPIYLDHNATTPLLPEVAASIARCQRQVYANPASQHEPGRRARQVLEDARDRIAEILGARLHGPTPDQLIFTSGGTEANNLAVAGFSGPNPGHLIVSAIEHPSIIGPAEQLRRRGWRVDYLGVSPHGVVDEDALDRLLRPDTQLVSVMLGSNETGVLQPVERLAQRCVAVGVRLHTDAVQAVGKLPVSFSALGVAAMTFTAHKFHGPVGIGALLVRHDTRPAPGLFGGFQQGGLRPGTEPVALVKGMLSALEIWQRETVARSRRLAQLRDQLEKGLLAEQPGLIVHGAGANRLPTTSSIAFPGVNRQALAIALDLRGVACSTGSACASGSSDPSPTLLAMGLPAELADSSLRFSVGCTTTASEVAEATRRILAVYKDLRGRAEGRKMAVTGRSKGVHPV